MAVNINYQGNIYDHTGESIECYYQAFSYAVSKWSDVRISEFGQYNVNFGDGDLNGQDGSVHVGDPLIVVFWTGADNRGEMLDIFSVIVFIYDGSDSTVQDVQLLPPRTPSCSFSINGEMEVDSAISVISNASIIYQWEYASKTHYHRPTWYGEDIFPFLGIRDDIFDFETGYSEATSHIYTSPGTYTISHLVRSTYDVESICTESVEIKYPEPTIDISTDSEQPVLGDIVTVNVSVLDPYDTVSRVVCSIDGEVVVDGDSLSFSYELRLAEVKTYTVSVDVMWYDFFNNNVAHQEKFIEMGNIPPEVDLTIDETESAVGIFVATVDALDPDGDISRLCWRLFYEGEQSGLPHPYFKCQNENGGVFRQIYEDCDSSATELRLEFSVPGNYIVSIEATDSSGESTTASSSLAVSSTCLNGEPVGCPNLGSSCPASVSMSHDIEGEIHRRTVKVTASPAISGKLSSTPISGTIKG